MSASASLVLPVTFGSAVGPAATKRILDATAGASSIAVNAEGGVATLGYEFPGNIDGLVRRLHAAGVTAGPTVKISVPVKNVTGREIDPAELLADLNDSPAVSGAAYDGNTVTATVACATNAFRYVYEEIIINGLMPLDVPTVAGLQDFFGAGP
jgi:hypothetical protein